MKNLKKRIIAGFLASLLLFMMNSVAFAAQIDTQTQYPEEIEFQRIGHGAYEILSSKSYQLTNGNIAYKVNDGGIYQDDFGNNYLKVNDDTLLRVGVVEVDLANAEEVESVLTEYNLPEETKNRIRERSEELIETNVSSRTMEIYSPTLLAGNNTTRAQSDYYTYDGCTLYDVVTYESDIPVGPEEVQSGSRVVAFMEDFVSAEIMGVAESAAEEVVGELGLNGLSLMGTIIDIVGDLTFTKHEDDYVTFYAEIGQYTKETFVDTHDGIGFVFGARTVKADFSKSEFDVHVKSESGWVNETVDADTPIVWSEHYHNPETVAVYSTTYGWTEELYMRIGNKTFYL